MNYNDAGIHNVLFTNFTNGTKIWPTTEKDKKRCREKKKDN